MKNIKIKSILASAFLAVVLLGLGSTSAMAQGSPGPFYSKSQLISYWQTQAPIIGAVTEVALNGYSVYLYSDGVGPALYKRYYSCYDGLIRENCGTVQGPHNPGTNLVNVVQAVVGGNIIGTPIFLDDNLIYEVPGPFYGIFEFKTCIGNVSQINPTFVNFNYIVLESGATIESYFPPLNCLPSL